MSVCGFVVFVVSYFFVMDHLGCKWWVARAYIQFTRAPVHDEQDERCEPEDWIKIVQV